MKNIYEHIFIHICMHCIDLKLKMEIRYTLQYHLWIYDNKCHINNVYSIQYTCNMNKKKK